ncbi:MAG: hypothetical protein QM758_05730 [Armatimonas sp.]
MIVNEILGKKKSRIVNKEIVNRIEHEIALYDSIEKSNYVLSAWKIPFKRRLLEGYECEKAGVFSFYISGLVYPRKYRLSVLKGDDYYVLNNSNMVQACNDFQLEDSKQVALLCYLMYQDHGIFDRNSDLVTVNQFKDSGVEHSEWWQVWGGISLKLKCVNEEKSWKDISMEWDTFVGDFKELPIGFYR